MSEPRVFGHFDSSLRYEDRRAAYAVIIPCAGVVVAVKGGGGKYWLPGGGSLPGEAAAETVRREVREELGRDVRLIEEIGQATQYFRAAVAGHNYKMEATFFRADFTNDEQAKPSEHELQMLPVNIASDSFFHECHTWAVWQAVAQAQASGSNV
ncbi:MAG TPA: NUDIX domain-containing protein [Pyrinomonadaceae bacterium]|nr:NUDIX domain-containing protein [Pyrinomonadaceae bacterium]